MKETVSEYCLDSSAQIVRECPDCIDKYMKLTASLYERLNRAIAWLKRIEVQYPGSINPGAIERHLMNE